MRIEIPIAEFTDFKLKDVIDSYIEVGTDTLYLYSDIILLKLVWMMGKGVFQQNITETCNSKLNWNQ